MRSYRQPGHGRNSTLALARLAAGIVLLLAAGTAPLLQAQSVQSPRILLLNSYHAGYPWTDAVTDGFRKAVLDSFPFTEIFIEYMDTKRYYDGPTGAYVHMLSDLYRLKYANVHIDLIAVSDDNAYDYILNYGDDLFGHIPVVFAGVSNVHPATATGHDNVTGVMGNTDDAATIDFMQRLQPGLKTVWVISGRTTSGIENRDRVRSLAESYRGELEFHFFDTGGSLTYAEVLKRVADLPPDSAILYEGFFRDSEGTYLPMTTVVPELSKQASVPIYVIHDIYLGLGVLGGKVNSGTRMGEIAGSMAVRILSGTPPQQVEPIRSDVNHYMADWKVLRRFDIPQSALPPGTVVIGRPENIFTRFPLTAWSGIAVIIAAVLLLAVMSVLFLQRRRANRALQIVNENLRITLNSIGDGVITTDPEGALTGMNPVAEQLTGWRVDEAVGHSIVEVFVIHNSQTGEPAENPVLRVLAEGRIVGLANHTVLTAKDGVVRQIADSGAPIRNRDGRITGVIMVFRDVSDEYQRRQELTESERRLRQSEEVARVGTWELDPATETIWGSAEAFRIYGLPRETPEITLDRVTEQALPEHRPILDEAMRKLLSDGEPYSVEFQIRSADTGDTRTVLSRARLVRGQDGRPARILGTVQDVTERAVLIEQLRQSVREKELLVQEIHHRVKNNLQVIISLISLQRGRISEEAQLSGASGGSDADTLLKESQTRVQAMALLHEVLYRSNDLSRINVGSYLSTVARHTFDAFDLRSDNRELEVASDDVYLDIDRAIPCGLIVNELISNSMKYAFSDVPLLESEFDQERESAGAGDRRKLIRLVISESEGGLLLEVSDNGRGLPPDFDAGRSRTLGTELIRALTAQLRASIRNEATGEAGFQGTRWVIHIPID